MPTKPPTPRAHATSRPEVAGPAPAETAAPRGGGACAPSTPPLRPLTPAAPEFPPALAGLRPPVATLWVRGRSTVQRPWVAVVGSRAADAAGLRAARAVARVLVQAGFGVLSGGALGVDAAAHWGALEAGGCTAALLASGVGRPGPGRNRALFAAMLAGSGLLLSERPPDQTPRRWSFARRNLLLAALAEATLVVQARAGSGSLITADHALSLGRPVWVVPGGWEDAGRAGGARLLAGGLARPLCGRRDLQRALALLRARPPAWVEARPPRPVDPAPRPPGSDPVLRALASGACHVDLLSGRTGLPAATLLARLTEYELLGQVVSLPGGRYALA